MSRFCLLSVLLPVLSSVSVAAAPLPPGARARLGTTDLWHAPVIRDLAFAADGKSFLSLSSSDAVVRQWDATSGTELRAFAGQKVRVTAFALSSDGRQLATVAGDRTVQLWNVATGKVIATWTRKVAPSSVAFAPDGKTLAVMPGDDPETVAVLEAASGKDLHTIKVDAGLDPRLGGFNPRFRDSLRMEGVVVFSPDGKFLAIHASQTITLWDTTSHKRVRRYDVTRTDQPRRGGGGGFGGFNPFAGGGYVGVQFSTDSQMLLAGSGAGGVLRWEVGSVEPLEPLQTEAADAIAVGKGIIAAAGQRGLLIWDADGKRLHQLVPESTLTVVACAPDGKTAVTGDREGHLRVWDVATGTERLQAGLRPVFRTLAVAGDAVITGDEFALLRWDLAGKVTKRLRLDPASLADLLLSPDGRTLAVRTNDGEVRLLDTTTGEARVTLEGKQRTLTSFQFSADGRWLAALKSQMVDAGFGDPVTTDRGVFLFDARTGKEVCQFVGSAPLGNEFVFLPDSRTLVTASSGDGVCLWETLTGKLRRTLSGAAADRSLDREDALANLFMRARGRGRPGRGFDPEVSNFTMRPQQLAVSPNGRTLAAVQRNSVSLTDLSTGKRLARLEGQTGIISCVVFSPDGRLLVTGGNDQMVHLWDGVTGKEIGPLSGHRGPVRLAVFMPDGKTLVTASEDHTALVWNVAEAVEAARQAIRSVPTSRPLEDLWTDLSGEDAQRADAALRELESRPSEALPTLKERLRPAAAVDAKMLAKWVAELDAQKFNVRKDAVAELEKAGEQARPVLEAALKNAPSQELKRLVTDLLKKLDERRYPAELVRDLRVLEAVERIGSAEAVKLLETLATGAANDPRTHDAKAALERLKRK